MTDEEIEIEEIEDEPEWYINHYRCPGNLEYRRQHAPVEWSDEWDCTCNDKCPECNAEIEPFESEDA